MNTAYNSHPSFLLKPSSTSFLLYYPLFLSSYTSAMTDTNSMLLPFSFPLSISPLLARSLFRE
jgi:hypothetical protein